MVSRFKTKEIADEFMAAVGKAQDAMDEACSGSANQSKEEVSPVMSADADKSPRPAFGGFSTPEKPAFGKSFFTERNTNGEVFAAFLDGQALDISVKLVRFILPSRFNFRSSWFRRHICGCYFHFRWWQLAQNIR